MSTNPPTCPHCEQPQECIINNFWMCPGCECDSSESASERVVEWGEETVTEDIDWHAMFVSLGLNPNSSIIESATAFNLMRLSTNLPITWKSFMDRLRLKNGH